MLTAADILKQKGADIISIHPDETVAKALEIMLDRKIGGILVKENDEYIGIWTERDLMKNVVTDGFYSKTSKIKDYMSTNLTAEPITDSIYQLMDKCLGRKHRHLLIEKDGKIVGILSGGDISRAQLMDKTKEVDNLNQMANWDYYEDWKWKKK
ncbi:MAG: CBS domain-containing protein [Melioribacteraceae bacterium]